MKIAVNTRLLLKGKLEGIGWFTYETLKRITSWHPEHEFIFIFDRKWSDEFVFSDNVKPVIAYPQARHPFLWYLFFDWGIPVILNDHKPDLFLSPDGWLSLRTKVPSVDVIHDLNFETYPEFIPLIVRQYYHYFFPRFAKKAARIATVSEYTKQDIVQKYGIDPGLIDVTYNGSNELYQLCSDNDQEVIREKFSEGQPYFVFIGAIHPRKNLANLFKAFDRFRLSLDTTVKLLIVGEKKWWEGDTRKTYESMKYHDQVIFTGRLSPADLRMVLCSALALTYVSFFEGFGIPIIEAFNVGTAVITSNTSSMPEVAANAALLADPFSVDSITDQMKRIVIDSDFREELIRKGKNRAKDFSWDKTAGKLWETIEKVAIDCNLNI